MSGIQHKKLVGRVQVVVLPKVRNQLDVNIVLVEVRLEPTKVFLQYNRLVHNVAATEKRLELLVEIVMAMEKFKLTKM